MKADHYVILNVIAATAGDVDVAAGVMTLADLAKKIRLTNCKKVTKKAYAAGTASNKTYALTGITLAASTNYKLIVKCPKLKADNSKNQEDNSDENGVRTYNWVSGASAPTAEQVATALDALVTADSSALTSITNTADSLRHTLLSVASGDFFLEVYVNGVLQSITPTVNTAYVAPSGTAALVSEITGAETGTANNTILSGGTYTTYLFEVEKEVPHNQISGLKGAKTEKVYVFLNTADATDHGNLVTELDAIIDGSSTAAVYNGIPTVSV